MSPMKRQGSPGGIPRPAGNRPVGNRPMPMQGPPGGDMPVRAAVQPGAVPIRPAMKEGGKVAKYAKGGRVSSRADGVAKRGKTKGRLI